MQFDVDAGQALMQMPTLRQFFWRSLVAMIFFAFGIWGMLAIWYQSPLGETPRSFLAAAFIVALAGAGISIIVRAARRFTMPLAYVCFLSVISWWSSINPSEYRDWAPDVARRSLVVVNKDDIEVRNVRNFAWISENTANERWETRYYKLPDLKTLDLFMSYWSGPDIAHTIVSFGFADGRQLAFSVETRKEKREVYDSIAGFFRQYELSLIAADEADIIKVRTNRRSEDVYRYRIDVKPENAQRLFLKYAEMTQALDRGPEFYNTLTTNCTTAPFSMIRSLDATVFPLDWRVFASGRVPEYLYDLEFIARALPFADARAAARITLKARASEDTADFSAAIR